MLDKNTWYHITVQINDFRQLKNSAIFKNAINIENIVMTVIKYFQMNQISALNNQ